VHYTTSCNTLSSAPEDGRGQRPNHVELIGIINKPLQLHLVGVYIIKVCPLFLIICTIFVKSYLTQNMYFDFFYDTFSILRRNEMRYDQACISVFMYSTGLHVQYRSSCTVPVFMYSTGLHVQYRFACKVPVFM